MSCCSDTQELVFALCHENGFPFLSSGRMRFLMSIVAHPLLNWQRRSQQLHPMGTPYSRILRGHRVGLGHLAEEGFHFPSREKRDENPATCLTDKAMVLMPSPRLSPSRSAPAARNTPEDLSADLDSLITLSSR